jgi:hypothetical protein
MGLVLLVTAGCNTLTKATVSVLDQGYICSVNQKAGVQLVTEVAAIEKDNARIGMDKSQTDSEEVEVAQDQFWIVRVNMGQQPSGGYGLRLISERLEISSDTAKIVLEWFQPKPGMIQTQALTYPCLHLKLAKGDYSRLEIVDQTGRIRHYLNLK